MFAFDLTTYELVPIEFGSPRGIAFGPGGIMAIVDQGNHNVYVFHADGTLAYQVGSGSRGEGDGEFAEPQFVAFGPGGIMAVSDYHNHRIQVFHANGTFDFWFGLGPVHSHGSDPPPGAGYPGNFSNPYGVTFGPGGIMAVSANNRLHVFHANVVSELEDRSIREQFLAVMVKQASIFV